MDTDLKKLEKIIKKNIGKYDEKLLELAFEFSKKSFEGVKRESGKEHFTHPFNVAIICAELGLDVPSIITALLHGLEKLDKKYDKEIKDKFGEEIWTLYNEVGKINLINKKIVDLKFADQLRKMILASSKDIRVILVKLADKLDNMRTLQYLDKKTQKINAKLTLEVYTPIANRLGLANIKRELEDLSLKFLKPEIYQQIVEFVPEKTKEREQIIKKNIAFLEKIIKKEKISARIFGRSKNIYSIYLKTKKNKLEDIYDLQALRIVVPEIKDCYDVLRIVHQNYKPIPTRFKDYIAAPKENNYQSIHTTVFDENNHVIEIQIRTEEMHSIAEEGVAAHFVYKGFERQAKYDKKISWLKEIMSTKSEQENEMTDVVKLELFSERIYCITPAGKVIDLPKGATAIDFAYAIHSDVGNQAIGARLDGKFVTLKTELQNGQVIEVVTQKNHYPSRGWLKFAKTHKARSKIRKTLAEHSKLPSPNYSKAQTRNEEVEKTNLIDIENIHPQKLKYDYKLKFARCCNPLPGEDIFAININGFTISIHRADCDKVKKQNINKDKLHKANWKLTEKGEIDIKIVCEDRKGLMADLLNTINRVANKITNANAKMLDANKVEIHFKFETDNLDQTKKVLNAIKNVRNVEKFYITKL